MPSDDTRYVRDPYERRRKIKEEIDDAVESGRGQDAKYLVNRLNDPGSADRDIWETAAAAILGGLAGRFGARRLAGLKNRIQGREHLGREAVNTAGRIGGVATGGAAAYAVDAHNRDDMRKAASRGGGSGRAHSRKKTPMDTRK